MIVIAIACLLYTVERERDLRRHKRLNLKMDDDDDDDEEEDSEGDGDEDIEGDELDEYEDEMDDDDDDDDDEYDEYDDDDEMAGTTKSSKEYIKRLEAQERLIREKLQKHAPEDEDDGDDSEGGDGRDDSDGDDGDGQRAKERSRFWGKSKQAYYDADNVEYELTDDEDDPAAEEKEARQIQRQIAGELQLDDFGVNENGTQKQDNAKLDSQKRSSSKGKGKHKSKVDMDEQNELKILLKEMTKALEEVRTQVAPLLDYIKKKKKTTTKDGMSYLDAKYLLLMSYCSHIAFYLLLKAEGRSVRDHPVMDKLIEIRTYLERTKPIDKRMKYQIEKLLDAASRDADETTTTTGLNLRPRPETLLRAAVQKNNIATKKKNKDNVDTDDDENIEDEDDDEENDDDEDGASPINNGALENGTYRPPRIAPTTMDGDDDMKQLGRQRRLAHASRKKIANSEYLRSVVAEMSGAPEEMQNIGTVDTSTRREVSDAKKLLSARLEAEEEAFVRLPVSMIEKKKMKAAERALGVGATLADFADDLDAIAELGGRRDDGEQGRLPPGMKKRKVGDVIHDANRDEQRQGKRMLSGDAELPRNESLNERRLKFNSRKIADRAIAERDAQEREARMRSAREEPDHPEYSKAVMAAENKKMQRAARNSTDGQMTRVPIKEAYVDGKRKISSAIQKNRGLTPHRKKLSKNPRKKHRVAYESALTRRKGQVQQVAPQNGAYGGEATGVRTKVSKSRKL